MLSARTICGEIFDNDEASGLFCSIVASEQMRALRRHAGLTGVTVTSASARPPAAQARTGLVPGPGRNYRVSLAWPRLPAAAGLPARP